MGKSLVLGVCLLFLGCAPTDLKPIEKYGGEGYVVVNIDEYNSHTELRLKNKDTIFRARVLIFDAKDIKVGDTIK